MQVGWEKRRHQQITKEFSLKTNRVDKKKTRINVWGLPIAASFLTVCSIPLIATPLAYTAHSIFICTRMARWMDVLAAMTGGFFLCLLFGRMVSGRGVLVWTFFFWLLLSRRVAMAPSWASAHGRKLMIPLQMKNESCGRITGREKSEKKSTIRLAWLFCHVLSCFTHYWLPDNDSLKLYRLLKSTKIRPRQTTRLLLLAA